MSPTYDIVLPHFGADSELTTLCKICLQSIREFSSNYRLVFIDNASPESEFNKILSELKLHPHKLIRNTENLGFIKAVNQGLALTTAPFIVIANNDISVVIEWLEKLREPLDNGAHLSGPRSSTQNSWQGRTRMGYSWEILGSGAMLAFFCTMFRKEVFDTIGFLDEDFGVGFGDDDWYCSLAQDNGFKLALVRSLTIQHNHRSTFHKLYGPEKSLQMQYAALKLLKEKQLELALSK